MYIYVALKGPRLWSLTQGASREDTTEGLDPAVSEDSGSWMACWTLTLRTLTLAEQTLGP